LSASAELLVLPVVNIFTQHRIPQHVTSTHSTIFYYSTTELALALEEEDKIY